jgi:hypothetical protein
MEKIFKAKRIYDGKWVEFSLFEMALIMLVDPSKAFISAKGVDVLNRNTICQYTGIEDSGNKKIFEGDKVYVAGVGKVFAKIKVKGVMFGVYDYQDCIEDLEYLTGHNIHDKG